MTEALIQGGFSQSAHDYSLFTKTSGSDIVIILIYVDDPMLTNSNEHLVNEANDILHRQFKVKDLGELRYFLGIEVLRSKEGILLNQRKYTLELISDIGLSTTKPVITPLELNKKFTTVDYDASAGILEMN